MAPIGVIVCYVVLAITAFPVWPLLVLAGVAFGPIVGVMWCDLGASIGGVCSVMVARWLAADWFHRKVESRMAKVKQLDEKLGHNGFLLVMVVRLIHFAPFGISNYIFGLLTVTVADVALGTLLGNLPAITFYVMLGHSPRALRTVSFVTVMVAMHVILGIPLLLRYLHPEWFKKIGVE